MTVKTNITDLQDESKAIDGGKSIANDRTAGLLRWATSEIERLRSESGYRSRLIAHYQGVVRDQCCKISRQRTAIDGLVQAVKGTTEWDEHDPSCLADDDPPGPCDCAHDELHAVVKAGEEATE